jgi:hypothetical protein
MNVKRRFYRQEAVAVLGDFNGFIIRKNYCPAVTILEKSAIL